MTLSVIGAGAFGTALAVALSSQRQVTLWGRDTSWGRNNPRLPGVPLPEAIHVTDDLKQARAATMLLALPAQKLAGFLRENAAMMTDATLVSCAKGIDLSHLSGPSTLISEICPDSTVAVLTGPSFAADIARGLPTALTLATADTEIGKQLQALLSTPSLRLYRTTDIIGAELGGALKNVIAIAAGVVMGAGLGDSARAAIVTRGFAEMTRLATSLGARPETLTGLSGLGDLVLTCNSPQSRNMSFGVALGRGDAFDPGITVEGVATARAISAMGDRLNTEMPIAVMVAKLADGAISVENAARELLNRPLREEE